LQVEGFKLQGQKKIIFSKTALLALTQLNWPLPVFVPQGGTSARQARLRQDTEGNIGQSATGVRCDVRADAAAVARHVAFLPPKRYVKEPLFAEASTGQACLRQSFFAKATQDRGYGRQARYSKPSAWLHPPSPRLRRGKRPGHFSTKPAKS